MKNNIVNKKIISIILSILLLFITTQVYAANDHFNTTIQTNTSQAKRGDTITVTIGLKDIAIESGEKGIGSYTASIKFDSSVLEYVSTNGTDKWDAPFYQSGLITATTKDGKVVDTAQNIGTITFKVKEDAKLGEATIGLTNFKGSSVLSDVSATDESIKLSVVDNNGTNNGNENNNPSGGNNNNNANGNGSNANGSANNSANQANTSKTNSTTSKKDNVKQGILPKAGTTNMIIWIAIGIVTILGIVFFTKMMKINRKMK